MICIYRILVVVCALMLCASDGRKPVKIVVAGIAQDGGIPQIGCTQEICRNLRRFVSSLVLMSGDTVYLFDATPDLRLQHAELIRRYPGAVRKNLFDAIFLTHAHAGHYTGLQYLGKESISTSNVPVFSSAEFSDYLRKNEPWAFLIRNGNIELQTLESRKELQFDSFSVLPVPVPHRKEFTDTHGFIIRGPSKSLLYIPDIDSWEPVKDEFRRWLNEVDYALLDGTFYSGKELPGRNMRLVPHPTVESSVSLLQSFPPFRGKVYFTHLNHTNPLLDPQSQESETLEATSFAVLQEWQEFLL